MNRQYGLFYLALILVITFGFTIGLTYAPCYASLCSEEFFALETRLHIVTYYGLVASIGFALCLRAYSPWWYTLSATNLTKRPVPVFDRRFTVGGLVLTIWVLGITLATTAFWFPVEFNHWTALTDPLRQWSKARVPLVVTGLIGHHLDIILGLLLIPVGRNSILGRVFSVHQSTLLYAHKLLAYLLLIGTVAHGIAYYVGHPRLSGPRASLMECRHLLHNMQQLKTTVLEKRLSMSIIPTSPKRRSSNEATGMPRCWHRACCPFSS